MIILFHVNNTGCFEEVFQLCNFTNFLLPIQAFQWMMRFDISVVNSHDPTSTQINLTKNILMESVTITEKKEKKSIGLLGTVWESSWKVLVLEKIMGVHIGKKPAFKKYDLFTLNTSCFESLWSIILMCNSMKISWKQLVMDRVLPRLNISLFSPTDTTIQKI